MTSRNEIFGSKFESENFQIYCYADEAGLLSHATIQEVDRTRFASLVNAPLDVSMQVTGQFSYVFYLDAEPVERKFLPQNYQLVYSEQPCGRSFDRWIETVIRYLCACFCCNAIPAFDAHEIASVLLEARQHRLLFNLVPFDTLSILPSTLDGEPVFNRLLAVVFYSPDWGFGDVFDKLELCECLGLRVVGGGAFHPYDERLVMLLGDLACCDQPSNAIKASPGPGDLPAIYE